MSRFTDEADGLVLRFGHLYGPGTAFAADGATVKQVRRRKMPIVGNGTATFSFTHTYDAATAILTSLSERNTGALNIVDDEPALVREWLPELATILGACQPNRVPTALARLAIGGWGVAFMTKLRGADNSRARQELSWKPHYPSWRTGFAEELR